jgi:hypothetical protein
LTPRIAFLETSAINAACDAAFDGETLHDRLDALGFAPALGMHVVYELARTFLNPSNTLRGTQLFGLLNQMSLSLVPPTDNLIRQELGCLRTGAAVLPFMNHVNQVAAQSEISRLAHGDLTEVARQFIEEHEVEVKVGYPRWADANISQFARARNSAPASVPSFQTVDDVYSYFEAKGATGLPALLIQIYAHHGVRVGQAEAAELVARLGTLHALRALVRANCYLSQICFADGIAPGRDKLGDYRHVVDASYCAAIVTADGQLIRTAPRINPALIVVPFESLMRAHA